MQKKKSTVRCTVTASLVLAGILGLAPLSPAQVHAATFDLKTGDTVNVGTGTVNESQSYDSVTTNGGTLNFGSVNDMAGAVNSAGSVVFNGGTITVDGSGNKISGALLMKPTNSRIPQVVPGTDNKFIDDTNPALVPPVHSVNAATTMTINNLNVNVGAPRYTGAPSAADISKSWEGLRLDLTSKGNMAINGGDFRVANIAYPIKKEDKAALRFESGGTMTVAGGQFTLQGQPVGNPARNNYDVPSLASMKAKDNLVIKGGTFDIQSARFHMGSTNGKVIIDGGTFNINTLSPYPGWATFDGKNQDRPESGNTQTVYNKFGSLDTGGSLVEVNGGTFNLGTPNDPSYSYFNLADKDAVFNGGTFNIYKNSNFGNNKAGIIMNGGVYNLIEGGYFGGRNTNGASVDIRGGTYNIEGGQGMFGYSIGVTTEAAYLNNDKYNKTSINISGGTFNYTGTKPTAMEKSTILADYAVNISGGEFIRKTDGVNSITAAFKSGGQASGSASATAGDLNISGGVFRTEKPANFTRDNNIVISRDDNVRMYNADNYTTNAAGEKVYQLHTEATVRAIFATNDEAKIKAAFAPKNNMSYLPTEKEVLTSLKAVMDYKTALGQQAWTFEAARNMNITGGHFDLSSTLASSFTAQGTLNISNATIISKSGGGTIDFKGKDGINILSGTIASYGGDENGAFALQYDYRNRLDRDRWTLGKYVNFITDGDIVIGAKGTAGPTIYYQDGMLGMKTKNLKLYSGSLTLNGLYRSTLQGAVPAAMLIDGGTFSILTSDSINRNKVDSSSMWNVPVTMKSGALNLVNAQLGGSHFTMEGGVATATGDSAINSNAVGYVDLKGGVVSLGNRAYIGAIKGDSLNYSPYVTATKDVMLGKNLTINLAVAQPTEGKALVVGKNIGGVYTSINNKGVATGAPTSITVADGSVFNISNPLSVDTGTYVAEGFIEAQNGTLTMTDTNKDARFYSYNLNQIAAHKADLTVNIKDAGKVIADTLSVNSNVRDNAYAFADLLRNAKGNWLAVTDAVVNAPASEASELLRQIGGENTTAAAQSMVGTMGEFRNKMRSQSPSNITGINGGDSMSANGYRGWVSGMGNWASQGTRNGVQGYDASSGGIAFGFDTTFAERYTVGLGLGYAHSYINAKDGKSEAKGDTFFVSLYGALDFDPVIIDADVTYANTNNQVKNTINAANVFAQNEGNYGIDTWSAGLKASYIFAFNNKATKIAPYVGIDFLSINQHGYAESGALARSFGSDSNTLWTLPVGVNFSHQFKGEKWSLTPELGLGYARDLNEFKPSANITVPGMSTSTIQTYGSQLAPDSFRANAGFTVKYKENLEFYGMYNLDARDQYTNHGVNVGFSYSF